MRWFAVLLIAAWMLAGGVLHLAWPEPFFVVVPERLPKLAVVWVSGLVEIAIGLGVLIPRTRALAGLGFALLCAAYLPLHVWDFVRPDPVFPVPLWASGRIIVQLGLIWLGVWVWRRVR